MRTSWLYAFSGWLYDLNQFGAGEAFFVFHQMDADSFPRQGIGHKDSAAVRETAESFTAIGVFFEAYSF